MLLVLTYPSRRDPATRQAILENDLALTFESLLKNPKNYSVWEHRKWLLQTMPDADWGREMKMVDVSLQKDGRNCASFFGQSEISKVLN